MGYCKICAEFERIIEDAYASLTEHEDRVHGYAGDSFKAYVKAECYICGEDHWVSDHDKARHAENPVDADKSRRIDALRAMARQNTSPHERDIAINKLKAMGITI